MAEDFVCWVLRWLPNKNAQVREKGTKWGSWVDLVEKVDGMVLYFEHTLAWMLRDVLHLNIDLFFSLPQFGHEEPELYIQTKQIQFQLSLL